MTLREALEALGAAGVSGAPVVAGGQLVGVASSTDFLEFQSSLPGVPPERTQMVEWGEFDTPEEDEEDLGSAFFVDRWSDSEAEVWTRISQTESPEWDRLDEHTVEEIMSRRLITVAVDVSVSAAAQRMLDERVHRVVVVEGDRLVGIVSAFDILREVAGRSASP
jgi:CBS domain-containing protein